MMGVGYGADGAIIYKFGEIADVAAAIGTFTGAMDGALEDLYRDFRNLLGTDFKGQAADALDQARTKWHQGATEIKDALRKVGVGLAASSEDMAATDRTIASRMDYTM